MIMYLLMYLDIRDLARVFITGCPNWDFKIEGVQNPIEKVKIITLSM